MLATMAPVGSGARAMQVAEALALVLLTEASAAAAEIAEAAPVESDSRILRDVFDLRTTEERRERHWSMMYMYGIALVTICCMYFYWKYHITQYVKAAKGMELYTSADRILVKILRTCSLRTVEGYQLRGIQEKTETVSIGFRDISTTIPGQRIGISLSKRTEPKKVLAGVSGQFEAGRMSAIMGPSGAGKTTFLNVLCGKTKAFGDWEVAGEVLINGVPGDISVLKPVMGFVPQDDIVHEWMTVRENLRFSAELRNAVGTSMRRLKRITEDVLCVLQLENQQNKLVGNRAYGGGLSGGQRKRVNVGMELAACPTLLFLDEPTSGLDSTSSLMLVEQLKKMTQLGMTVVMVIHQPRYSLFTLIDDVLLLGKGGRTVFVGPTKAAKPYFERMGFEMPENENPADWFMDVASGMLTVENPQMPSDQLPGRLFEAWEEKENGEERRAMRIATETGMPSAHTASDLDDREVIKRHIKDEWNKVSPDAAPLGKEAFKQVLYGFTGSLPDDGVVEELMLRMLELGSVSRHATAVVTPTRNEKKVQEVTQHQLEALVLSFRGIQQDNEDEEEEGGDEEESGTSSSDDADEDTMLSVESKAGGPRSLARKQPGMCRHLKVVMHSRALQWWRRQDMRILFFVVIEFAAVFLGMMDAFIFDTPPWMPTGFLQVHISIALLTCVKSLACFSEDQPVFWRESSHGLNKLAFLLGRTTIDSLDWVLMCFFFTSTYYVIVGPELEFLPYFWPFLLVAWVASGWSYVISATLPTFLGPFVSALLSFMVGGILGLPDKMGVFLDGGILETIVSSVCFTRWSVQMDFLAYIYRDPPDVEKMDQIIKIQYDMFKSFYLKGHWKINDGPSSAWWTGVLALLAMGTVLRVVAYLGLRFVNAAKQV
mmetsp:Transcript_287/g.669  ORF Transcript_287/g.669 Transcript_287/m.669 type:complete len:885 (-) Transcript_287:68-2722(-)